MENTKCRWSPTLGALEDTAQNVWGIGEYNPLTDSELPTVFFGLYGLPDWYTLWRHKGKKYVLWAGSDIIHFKNGYWLEDGGGIHINDTFPFAEWINKYCENWCENEVERKTLELLGIKAKVCPSFLGDINQYPVTFIPSARPKIYLSANPGREEEYGWGVIEKIAEKCEADFYLYGSANWITKNQNVYIRGRVPKEVMNEEVKKMQCGLRLNEGMDGFSEITAKSVLWGQYPLVWEKFKYPDIGSFNTREELIEKINALKDHKGPNPARELYRKILNLYPWNHAI